MCLAGLVGYPEEAEPLIRSGPELGPWANLPWGCLFRRFYPVLSGPI